MPPYGDQFFDWLGLDEAYRQRHLLFPMHTNNWLGFVEVTDSKGTEFEETASREGVLETPAFFELRDFLYKALIAGAMRVNERRDVKIKTGPRKISTENPRAEAEDIAVGIHAVMKNAVHGTDEERHASEEAVRVYAERIIELGSAFEDQISEQQLLRVLAGVGTTVGEFTHEIRTVMGGLKNQFGDLVDQLSEKSTLRPDAEDISKRLDLLHSYSLYFHDVFLDNIRRELEIIDLREIISQFKGIVETVATRTDIAIESELDGYDLFTRPMHRSEWASILLNLYTNAIKAIKRADADGKICLKAGESGDRVYLEFSDDGAGVPDEYKERVFEPFFSTTQPASPLAGEAEQLTGMGLGLKIVRDIVEGYNGEIFLTSPKDGYSTCFRIEIPRASEEEIPKDAY